MKIKSILMGATLCVLPGMSAMAIDINFYGFDKGLGEYNHLTVWGNSDAASADFQSYLVGVGTETFESKAVGAPPGTLTFPGAGSATFVGSATVEQGWYNVGRGPISGTKWVDTAAGNFKINFSDPVAAFGFYGVDIGDFGGDLLLKFIDGTTRSFTFNTSGSPGGSVMFFGYINDENPFESVEFHNTEPGWDFFGFDDMTIGSVEQVEPPGVPDGGSTVALIGVALSALGAFGRKFRA